MALALTPSGSAIEDSHTPTFSLDSSKSKARKRSNKSTSSPCETKINIGSVIVYNFSSRSTGSGESFPRASNTTTSPVASNVGSPVPSIANLSQQEHRQLDSYLRTFSSSSTPFCRICHESDGKEDLISPCYCSGTMGLVHITCMERWLSATSTDSCELCRYKFKTKRTPKSCCEWLRDSNGHSRHHRSLIGDGICFALLTPLAAVSGFLCIEGAHRQTIEGNRMEAACLLALSSVLAVVYFLWTSLTMRFYYRHWNQWKLTNHNIKMIFVRRVSNTRLPVPTICHHEPVDEINNNEHSHQGLDVPYLVSNDSVSAHEEGTANSSSTIRVQEFISHNIESFF